MMGLLTNITFHGIGDPNRRLDEDEERVWLDMARFCRILDAIVGCKRCVITFDDANSSDCEYALPELVKRDLTASFFLVARRIGDPHYLSNSQIGELRDSGMLLGSHGALHRSWRGLSASEMAIELGDAKEQLAEYIGVPVVQAACPFGAYDRASLRALRQAGYERVYTSDRYPARPSAWLQARYTIRCSDDERTVRKWLNGAVVERWATGRLRTIAKSVR